MKKSIILLSLLLSSCSSVMQVQQQQQLKSDVHEFTEDIKEIKEDIDDFRASVRKAVAAKLHITTGDNKDEESVIHLDDEELKTVKSVLETIKDAPPIGANAWRIGGGVLSIARVGYSALKSLRFLNEHGEEIVSFAIGDDDDDEDESPPPTTTQFNTRPRLVVVPAPETRHTSSAQASAPSALSPAQAPSVSTPPAPVHSTETFADVVRSTPSSAAQRDE